MRDNILIWLTDNPILSVGEFVRLAQSLHGDAHTPMALNAAIRSALAALIESGKVSQLRDKQRRPGYGAKTLCYSLGQESTAVSMQSWFSALREQPHV